MWVAGLAVFYLFYKLFISWYLKACNRDFLHRPMIFSKGWFHPAMWVVSLSLLGFSTYLFFASSPWLSPAPIMLSLFLIRSNAHRRNAAIGSTIEECVALAEELRCKGVAQREAYKEMIGKMMGESPEGCELWADSLLEVEQTFRSPAEMPRRDSQADDVADAGDGADTKRVREFPPGPPQEPPRPDWDISSLVIMVLDHRGLFSLDQDDRDLNKKLQRADYVSDRDRIEAMVKYYQGTSKGRIRPHREKC